MSHWVVFSLDAGRYALPLQSVERIVRAAQITVLPQAPPPVLGAIDVAGRVLPVFNLRQRFGLPQRSIAPSDQFLIARTVTRTIVLAVDAATEVIEYPAAAVVDAERIASGLTQIRGALQLEEDLVLIHDLETLLSADEGEALDALINKTAANAG